MNPTVATRPGALLSSGSAPAVVLLGWELGGGFGHVRPLLQLARALADEGYAPVLAVKDLIAPQRLLRDAPCPVIQAPIHPERPPAPLVCGYADILANHDFDDPDRLEAVVRGWQGLIDALRPAVVVAEHAPALCLAAHGAVPVVQVGTGFTVPPAGSATFPPLPRLLPGQTESVPEPRVLEVVREVQRRRGRPVLETLPELFETAGRFVTELPELDTYRDMRGEPAVGPLTPPPSPLPPHATGFFAYLNAELPPCESFLVALARSGCRGRAFARGASQGLRTHLRGYGLEVLDAPVPQDELLREAGVIVHHGGSGLSNAALAAGRPQMVFPVYLEQFLTAVRLGQLGVARYLINPTPAEVVEVLRQLLTDPGYTRRAQDLAADLHARGPWHSLPLLVARCRELAGGTT